MGIFLKKAEVSDKVKAVGRTKFKSRRDGTDERTKKGQAETG
jgi:hypothetical protein